jgi:hypothetical protein
MPSETAIRFEMHADSFKIEMERRPLIRFFTLNGLKARVIHTEVQSVCGLEALARPTVTNWRRRFHQGRADMFDDPRSKRPLTNGFASAIGSVLEERPFSSCKVLCHRFWTGKAASLRILQDKLDLKRFHLYWVSHALRLNRRVKECHIRSIFLQP